MRLRVLRALALLLAGCLLATWPAFAGNSEVRIKRPLPADAGEVQVVVKFRTGAQAVRAHALAAGADRASAAAVLQRRADALAIRHGLLLTSGRALSAHTQVVRAEGVEAAALARALAADPEVEYAVVDRRRRPSLVPADPYFAPDAGSGLGTGQWYLGPPSAQVPAAIDAASAWDVSVGRSSMVVAVLDSGVRFDHPDLAGKLLTGRDMVSRANVWADGDGRDADASDPGDHVSAAESSGSGAFNGCDTESSWHGTMIAGLLAANTGNGLGIAGLTWNVKVLPVRVLGKCFGYDSDIAAGIRWAAGLPVPGEPVNPVPARVINLSLGGDGACDALYADTINAVAAAGAVVVAAAGNGHGRAVESPANCPGVIAVAGLTHRGSKVEYSDIGPEIALAAPAGDCAPFGDCQYPIVSTSNSGRTAPVVGSAGATYGSAAGTSFSAPMVSGTAALLLSINPALTPAQVKDVLKLSARSFPNSGDAASSGMCQSPGGFDQQVCYCTTATCGAGLLDAGAAVRLVAQYTPGAPGGLQAAMSASPVVPTAGDTVTLSGAPSQSTFPIISYAWSIVSGSATLSGPVNEATATLSSPAGGDVLVRLTVADTEGNASSVDQALRIVPAATSNTAGSGTVPSARNSDAGGGAVSWPGLLGLALAVCALRRPASAHHAR